jgi:hypothetical protein
MKASDTSALTLAALVLQAGSSLASHELITGDGISKRCIPDSLGIGLDLEHMLVPVKFGL